MIKSIVNEVRDYKWVLCSTSFCFFMAIGTTFGWGWAFGMLGIVGTAVSGILVAIYLLLVRPPSLNGKQSVAEELTQRLKTESFNDCVAHTDPDGNTRVYTSHIAADGGAEVFVPR